MFAKISRYRPLPDIVVRDPQGRKLASKSLRLLPDVTGDFLHTIEEGDRLDVLAYKYYSQSRDWWRIADANDFLSPEALLGNDPWETLQIPVSWDGPDAPWSDLLRLLRDTPGVETAATGSDEQPVATTELAQGAPAFDVDPDLSDALDAGVRSQAVPPPLEAALSAEGVTFTGDVRLGKVDAATWHVTNLETRAIHTFRLFDDPALLNVYESTPHVRWTLTLVYNTAVLSSVVLLDLIETQGFGTSPAATIGRAGKSIIIPRRRA